MTVRRSGIGGNPNDPNFLQRVAETLRVWNGEGRDQLDRVVTVRDLVEGTDTYRLLQQFGIPLPGGGGGGAPGQDGGGGPDPVDRTPPPAPENLNVRGAFLNVILSWDFPTGEHWVFFEIYRANTDELGQAELIGTTQARVFVNELEHAQPYYYWVRAVRMVDPPVPGPYNATAGTLGEPAQDPAYVRSLLTSAPWRANHTYLHKEVIRPSAPVVRDGIDLRFQVALPGTSGAVEPDWSQVGGVGDTLTDGAVTWMAVEPGTAPLVTGVINGTPVVLMHGAVIEDASIENAKIKDLAADKLFVAEGTIAEALIGEAEITNAMIGQIIQSDNFVTGVSGWRLHKNGDFEANNALFRGGGQFWGTLLGADGYFDGTVYVQNLEGDVIDRRRQEIGASSWIQMSDTLNPNISDRWFVLEVIELPEQPFPRLVHFTGFALDFNTTDSRTQNQGQVVIDGSNNMTRILYNSGLIRFILGTGGFAQLPNLGGYVWQDRRLVSAPPFLLPANERGYIRFIYRDYEGPSDDHGVHSRFRRGAGLRTVEAYKEAEHSIYWSYLHP